MQWERPERLFARHALTGGGWQRDVVVTISADGHVADVTADGRAPAGAPAFDLLLPGMANAHSHAFQRAMAGLTELASAAGRDNFWSWREVMYAFNRNLTPEQMEAVARALYVELLEHGYTAVGEFHYLHHDPQGRYYAGIICERRGKAQLHRHAPGANSAAYEALREAMERYEQAIEIRPPENDDAMLRWNTCARVLMRNPNLQPAREERFEHPLE